VQFDGGLSGRCGRVGGRGVFVKSDMFGLSPWELGIVVLVLVVLFGPKRLPDLGSSLGKAINNFKKSYHEENTIDVTPKDRLEAPKSGAETQPQPQRQADQRTE